MADTFEATERANLLATGGRAAATLAQSVAGKSQESLIETNAGSLRGLSDVIGALVDEAHRCGGYDCMGRSIDGTKLWVTHDRFDAVNRRASRYEAALRGIAGAIGGGDNELDMLVDWQGTAHALSAAARRALDEIELD